MIPVPAGAGKSIRSVTGRGSEVEAPMNIELFYFKGCPNYERALEVIKEALLDCELTADIRMVNIKDQQDAVAKRFMGSPSVRIDGRDIEIADERKAAYSMRCRRYRDGEEMIGYPPKQLVIEMLRKTSGTER